ncbi:hypothetical protein F4777DRAFT_566639 [Nemania sp. FL0916]|nr:hypothetical protein F4777DRAFT_566639 [Nemania sp. FL0916]
MVCYSVMCHGRAIPLGRLRRHLCFPQIIHLNNARRIQSRGMATSTEKTTIKRAVAGSFLFKFPGGDIKKAKVALFRRSNNVTTYQRKLAPCSGSVEEHDASPLATALREIQEETTLPASSLDLLCVGKPYSFVDKSVGREWSINPFAFRIKDVLEGGKGEKGITLDWEHEGIEWFDPLQVNGSDEFGGVPRIVESLRRVWPQYDLGREAGTTLTEGVQMLRNEREHGARVLAAMGIMILREVIRKMTPSKSVDESWSKIRMAAWHICQSRPSMAAAITSAMVKALCAIRPLCFTDRDLRNRFQRIGDELNQQLSLRGSTSGKVCGYFAKILRDNILESDNPKEKVSILTLSLSSTVSEGLLRAASTLGVELDVRIMESRPRCEGVTLGSRILKESSEGSKLKVTLYHDASISQAAHGVDFVLLGADRISSAGDVYNKIGSLPAVLTARYITPNAKILVLSETEKIAGPGSMDEHVAEENSPLEVSRVWKEMVKGAGEIEEALCRHDPRIAVKNAYFEWVPAELIDAYATEEGLCNTERIRQKSALIGYEIERYFKDL